MPHLPESVSKSALQRLRTQDLRASLTVLCLLTCTLAVFLLSSIAEGLEHAEALLHGLATR